MKQAAPSTAVNMHSLSDSLPPMGRRFPDGPIGLLHQAYMKEHDRYDMSVAFAAGEASSTGDVLIENIRIVDGKGNAPVEAQDVLVAKGRIARVTDHGEFETAAEAKRIDGEGLTLMPSLIDAHSHILMLDRETTRYAWNHTGNAPARPAFSR